MPVSKPAQLADESRDSPILKAIDAAGHVWSHPNPVALYRFIAARNELLRTISASPR